jgi:type VI secretion system protein ImpA
MSDEIIDTAALLAPLDGGDGAGSDPRQDFSATAPYQRLRDARADARAEERDRDAGDGTEAPLAAGWRDVRRLAVGILETKAKDFEVAAWLTESLVRSDGLAGLAAGAHLLSGLLAGFWDNGYPQPDEDGLEGRSAPIGGLAGGDADGTIMQALRRTILFVRPAGEALALYQFDVSEETAGIADEQRREQRYAQGVIPFDTILAEAAAGRAALQGLIARTQGARDAWAGLESALAERFGSDAPPTRRVTDLLDRLIAIATRLGGAPAPTAEPNLPAAGAEDGGDAMTSPGTSRGRPFAGFGAAPGAGIDRERALEMLEEIAAFFRRTEPHSFLAYTLTDAARRGRMPLPALLAEVLPDDAARSAMLTALGIRAGTLDIESGGDAGSD